MAEREGFDLQEFRKQRKCNAYALTCLGIPAELVENRKRLCLLVQEGDDIETGRSHDWIASEHCAELIEILEQQFSGTGWELINALRSRTSGSEN